MKDKQAANKGNAKQDEVFAAIAMALNEMQYDVHDVENMVLTIKRSAPSPWSLKLLNMRQAPRR